MSSPVSAVLQRIADDVAKASSDSAAAVVAAPSRPQAAAMLASDAPSAGNPFVTKTGHRAQVTTELGFLSLASFGAVGDGLVDDTRAVQDAFDAAIAQRVELRSASGMKYRITDTIYVGPSLTGRSGFASFSFDGAHCGYDADVFGGSLRGCMFIAENANKPAFAIQSIRFGKFANCTIQGGLKHSYLRPSFNSADYTAGLRDSRYSPHAGIAIDPYSGPRPPDGGYAGAIPFGSTGSFKIAFEHVRVQGFVCGLVIQPSGADANASSVSVDHGEINECCYGVSVCGSQNRNVLLKDCSINNCMEAVTNVRHGAQFGSIPKVWGGEWTYLARLFYVRGDVDSFAVDSLYCESIRSIGVLGQAFSAPCAAAFTGCNFTFIGNEPGYGAACILDHAMPVSFTACNLTLEDSVFGVVTRTVPAQLTSCLIFATQGDGWLWLPGADATRMPELRGCVVKSNGPRGALDSGTKVGVNSDGRCTKDELASARTVRYLPTARRVDNTQNSYELRVPRDIVGWQALGRKATVSASVSSYAATGKSLSLVGDDTDFAVGDVLLWPMLAVSAALPTALPSLRVTSAANGVITCAILFDASEYDTLTPVSKVQILPQFWAWVPSTPPLRCTWSAGSNVVACSADPRLYLRVGDFVFQQAARTCVGINRVRSLNANSFTLSKPAAANAVALPTFGEMARSGSRFAYTFTAADVAAQRLVISHGMQGKAARVSAYGVNGNVVAISSLVQSGTGEVTATFAQTVPAGACYVAGSVVEIEE